MYLLELVRPAAPASVSVTLGVGSANAKHIKESRAKSVIRLSMAVYG